MNNHWLEPLKQDSGRKCLKGWSIILHHIVKSNRKTEWLSIKVATFWNNKTGVVFMYGSIFKDRSKNSAIFKMELFLTIGNGRVYNKWTVVFACYSVNSIIFTGKIKIGWKWPCLEGGIRYDFLFCRPVFTFFWKPQLLSVLLTFCFISKINYKN